MAFWSTMAKHLVSHYWFLRFPFELELQDKGYIAAE